jgi:hypothetical protein
MLAPLSLSPPAPQPTAQTLTALFEGEGVGAPTRALVFETLRLARTALAAAWRARGPVAVYAGMLIALDAAAHAIGPLRFVRQPLLVALPLALIRSWLWADLTAVALSASRDLSKPARIAMVPPGLFVGVLLVTVVDSVTVLLGAALFILPGLFVLVIWSQASFLVLDRRAVRFDALRASFDLTEGSRVSLAAMAVLGLVVLMGPSLLERSWPAAGVAAFALGPGAAVIGWIWSASQAALSAFVLVAVYLELLSRSIGPAAAREATT